MELIKLMVEFREKGVEFKSFTEGIDTTTAMGSMWFMLSAIFSENEREIKRERSRTGLQAARARGRVGGRPKGLSAEAIKKAVSTASMDSDGKSISEIRKTLGIGSNTTVYKYLRSEGVDINGWEQKLNKK